jgi:hypothetical protein
MAMKLGKPKHEQSTKNYFAFGKDKNTFILRILPPMGELADAGKWSVYHRVEFGHTGTDGRMKPFLSPRVVNYQGMVEVESESHTRREKLKAQMEQAKAAGNSQLQEQCFSLLRKYNQDAKHYMNAVDLQGNVGLFKIGHRGYQALKAAIDAVKKTDGIEPIGIETGRFFVFSRSGKGRDTVYTVQEYKRKQEMVGPDGNKIVADVSFNHALDENLISKLETDAFELNKVYPSVTAEEESRIINEGATAVDEILGKKKESNKPDTSTEAVRNSVPEQPVGNTAAIMPTGETVDTNTGEVLENVFTPPVQESTPTPAASDVSSMSEEDFFKKIESGNF